MRFGGYAEVARAFLATWLRKTIAVPVWCGDLIAVAADITDPAMPESIWRPREWLPRLWSRRKRKDLQPPTGA